MTRAPSARDYHARLTASVDSYLTARIRRHPRAGAFRALTDAVPKGGASAAQMKLAEQLAAEVRP